MSQIDYEQDRVQSVTQADAAKSLSDKVIELKNLEDEISNAEKSVSKLKEQAKTLSQFDSDCSRCVTKTIVVLINSSFKALRSLSSVSKSSALVASSKIM